YNPLPPSAVVHLLTIHSYVLVIAASTFFVNFYHFFLTRYYRRASGIQYPAPYASNEQAEKDPNAFAFNCAQRAHQNFPESHTSFLGALLLSWYSYPVASAAFGAGWVLSRIVYAYGYSHAGPPGRLSAVKVAMSN
ncbi:MAPEG family protein, partial [Penicillium hispanicum]|uniref:MAPEG family protein n=1 Tax=Penicillium hispanicum TaxID=1080232 RepID=UPI0025404752